ncbi:MAG: hypothetical protein E6R03_06635 [Hyphomicrobiaceae bacterium]|nr:MAG: hypothetical protein E6R03_06635 [Hyphomicrobiaceae bacterium]
MKKYRLSQVLTVEKGIKQKLNTEGAELHKMNQKPDLFSGMVRNYEKSHDDGEDLPSEDKKVLGLASSNLMKFASLWADLADVTATKDFANASAFGKLDIGGEEVSVPVPYLIWLEKQLDDMKTFVSNLPELSPERDWTLDENRGFYKSNTVKTVRTKKVPKVVVLYEATDKHPAQVQLQNEDVLVGYWETTHLSGAVSRVDKHTLLAKVEKFRNSVKQAREEANTYLTTRSSLGSMIVSHLLNTKVEQAETNW